MTDSLQKLLEPSESILVLLPHEPAIDPAAAGLALYLYLQQKKQISVACPSPMRVEHNRLVGVDKISSQVGEKNLVVKLSDYNPDHIDTVVWDIVNGEFQLNVVTKQQAKPPKQEQVKLDYRGIASDLIILLGGREQEHFPILQDEKTIIQSPQEAGKKVQVAHIGIEDLNVESGHKIISLARPASSISELVAQFILDLEREVHADIASNLLTGIYEGSDNFSNDYVSADTFQVVANLMKNGGKMQKKMANQQTRPTKYSFPQSTMMPQMPKLSQGQFMQGAAPMATQTPNEYTEKVEGESVKPPKEWIQTPKIYKGTSVS